MKLDGTNRLVITLVLLIVLGIVVRELLALLAQVLPWLALGLAATAVIVYTVRVFVNRRSDL